MCEHSVLSTRESVIPLCVNKSVPDSVLSTRESVIPLCVIRVCPLCRNNTPLKCVSDSVLSTRV